MISAVSRCQPDAQHAIPIRYRGYYYDEESGLYYLNARYYSPTWRRFISPDDTAYLDAENPNGLNLYTYCNNDPVNNARDEFSNNSSIDNSPLPPATADFSLSHSILNYVLLNDSFRCGIVFGKITVTGLNASGNCRAQLSIKKQKFVIGAFGKFSLLNATGQIGLGNEDLNASVVFVGDLGTISGMAGVLIDPQKSTCFAGVEAKASVFSARGGIQFCILGKQVEAGVSANVLSVGFQFGIGIKDGEFYYNNGVAALFGYDFYLRIKFA